MDKKFIDINRGWYRYNPKIKFHQGKIYFNNNIVEADVIDDIIEEQYMDNTSKHYMNSLEELITLRKYIYTAIEAYCLVKDNLKDKIIIILTNENKWWELLIKDKKLYSTRIEDDNIELIFKNLYLKYKYNQWIKIDLFNHPTITQKMKALKQYLKDENR